ncbi:MAG: nitrate/nitrite transporter [Halolamina sp.]
MQTDPTPVGDSRPRTLGLVVGLFVLSTSAAAYEIAPASVVPLVRAGLGVGPTGASALVSAMYAASVALSVPLGVALDRLDLRRAVVAAGLALLVAGAWSWVAAVDGAYWSLLGARLLAGACYVTVWNAGTNVIGAAVPESRRATAVGLFTASAPVGFALGQFGGPRVAAAVGWAAVLPAFAALAAVGVVVFAAATRGRSVGADTDAPDRAALRSLFGDRAVWTLSTLCFLAFALYLFLNSWLPSFFNAELSVSLAAGGLLTALFPATGVVARTGVGSLSEIVFGGRRRPVVVLAFGLATAATGGLAVVGSVPIAVGLLVVGGLGVQFAIGLLFAYVVEVVPAEVRTTAVSVLTAVGLFGATVAPVAGGGVAAVAGYRPAFLLAAAVAVVGAVLALTAPEPATS